MLKQLAQHLLRNCASGTARMRQFTFLVLVGGILLAACGPRSESTLQDDFQVYSESTFGQDVLSGNRATIIIFLSPDCPLCENYSLNIKQLKNAYPSEEIVFYGIFPGKNYTNPEIQGYLYHYKPPVIPILDPDYTLTERLGARVTPEVFVLDSTGTLRYQGAIDNWIPKLGQKRTVVNEHYLADALAAIETGTKIPVVYTKAVGCFIE